MTKVSNRMRRLACTAAATLLVVAIGAGAASAIEWGRRTASCDSCGSCGTGHACGRHCCMDVWDGYCEERNCRGCGRHCCMNVWDGYCYERDYRHGSQGCHRGAARCDNCTTITDADFETAPQAKPGPAPSPAPKPAPSPSPAASAAHVSETVIPKSRIPSEPRAPALNAPK